MQAIKEYTKVPLLFLGGLSRIALREAAGVVSTAGEQKNTIKKQEQKVPLLFLGGVACVGLCVAAGVVSTAGGFSGKNALWMVRPSTALRMTAHHDNRGFVTLPTH